MSDGVMHPGKYISDELKARKWKQTDLAWIIGCSIQKINRIINGKSGISADMAKALAQAFNIEPETFLGLQNAYDLSKVRADDQIAIRARTVLGRGERS